LDGRKEIWPIKNPFTNSQRFCSGTGGGGPEGNWMTQVDLEKRPLDGSSSGSSTRTEKSPSGLYVCVHLEFVQQVWLHLCPVIYIEVMIQ